MTIRTGKFGPRGPYKKKDKDMIKETKVIPLVSQRRVNSEEMENNPFEIKEDITLISGTSNNPALMSALLSQVIKLDPKDPRKSVNIPLTICPTRGTAQNLVLALRRLMSESTDKEIKEIVLQSKAVNSLGEQKEYLGTRLWRTA